MVENEDVLEEAASAFHEMRIRDLKLRIEHRRLELEFENLQSGLEWKPVKAPDPPKTLHGDLGGGIAFGCFWIALALFFVGTWQ